MSKGNSPSNESLNAESSNPTPMSESTKKLFAKFDVNIGKVIRKGQYGAIYEGEFGSKFDYKVFNTKFECNVCQMKNPPNKSQRFAIKYVDIVLRKKLQVTDVMDAVDRDINALMAIDHKGVVKLYFAIAMDNKNLWLLFMQLSDGNLQTFMKRKRKLKEMIDELVTKQWFKSLSETLDYLQRKRISHGHIKASNVLIFGKQDDKIQLKLTDFVFAKIERLGELSEELKQILNDRLDDDIIDMSFLFNDLLSITQFAKQDTQRLANETVHQMMVASDAPQEVLKKFMSSDYLK